MSQVLVRPRMRRLRLSPTLFAYIARQFIVWVITYLLAISGVILLVGTVDLLDRLSSKNARLTLVVEMALLKLPFLLQEVMPFIILLAALTSFWRLTRSHEVVVTRAAGVSIWQFLTPTLAVATIAGGITMTMLNPLAAILFARYGQLEARYVHNEANLLSVSEGGLWLRQGDPTEQVVIHARRATGDPMVLHEVIVFRFADSDTFVERADASRAELAAGRWILYDTWTSRPGTPPRHADRIELPTDLTNTKIIESFAPPETISFWSLPDFIDLLENAGFSAVRHKLQMHKLLVLPLLFAAMVLLAAMVALRPQRRRRVGWLILGGVLSGFLVYFLSNFVFALGISGKIPVVLAAWTPGGVTLLVGIATLLHLEDG